MVLGPKAVAKQLARSYPACFRVRKCQVQDAARAEPTGQYWGHMLRVLCHALGPTTTTS
jgi:hypothetical protein